MNATTTTDTEYQIGDIVELHATPCSEAVQCGSDCGCREMAARNGHRGVVLNAQHPLSRFPDALPYYQIDGLDWIVSHNELRAVQS